MNKKAVLKELTTIPGIGPSLANDLFRLGIRSVQELGSCVPEELYAQLCERDGPTDRCVLYTFRCAVYFAANENRDPELLKWWNWKD